MGGEPEVGAWRCGGGTFGVILCVVEGAGARRCVPSAGCQVDEVDLVYPKSPKSHQKSRIVIVKIQNQFF